MEEDHQPLGVVFDPSKPASSHFSCITCSASFRLKSNCVAHVKSQHLQIKVTCPDCGLQVKKLRQHRSDVHRSVQVSCSVCKREFRSERLLRCHMKNKHKLPEYGFRPSHDAVASCPVCRENVSRAKLTYHLQIFHYLPPGFSTKCPICLKLVKHLPWHVNKVHRSLSFMQDLHLCRRCRQYFTAKIDLEEHEKNHSKYRCPECQKEFVEFFQLGTHLLEAHRKVFNSGREKVDPKNNLDLSKCVDLKLYEVEEMYGRDSDDVNEEDNSYFSDDSDREVEVDSLIVYIENDSVVQVTRCLGASENDNLSDSNLTSDNLKLTNNLENGEVEDQFHEPNESIKSDHFVGDAVHISEDKTDNLINMTNLAGGEIELANVISTTSSNFSATELSDVDRAPTLTLVENSQETLLPPNPDSLLALSSEDVIVVPYKDSDVETSHLTSVTYPRDVIPNFEMANGVGVELGLTSFTADDQAMVDRLSTDVTSKVDDGDQASASFYLTLESTNRPDVSSRGSVMICVRDSVGEVTEPDVTEEVVLSYEDSAVGTFEVIGEGGHTTSTSALGVEKKIILDSVIQTVSGTPGEKEFEMEGESATEDADEPDVVEDDEGDEEEEGNAENWRDYQLLITEKLEGESPIDGEIKQFEISVDLPGLNDLTSDHPDMASKKRKLRMKREELKLVQRFPHKADIPRSLRHVSLSHEDESVIAETAKVDEFEYRDLNRLRIGRTPKSADEGRTRANRHMFAASRQPHLCPYCKAVLKTKLNLKHHIDVRHFNNRSVPCDRCDKAFANRSELRRHVTYAHPDSTASKTGELQQQQLLKACHVCSQLFKPGYLARHIQYKHSAAALTPASCHVCSKSFKTREIMLRHVRTKH